MPFDRMDHPNPDCSARFLCVDGRERQSGVIEACNRFGKRRWPDNVLGDFAEANVRRGRASCTSSKGLGKRSHFEWAATLVGSLGVEARHAFPSTPCPENRLLRSRHKMNFTAIAPDRQIYDLKHVWLVDFSQWNARISNPSASTSSCGNGGASKQDRRDGCCGSAPACFGRPPSASWWCERSILNPEYSTSSFGPPRLSEISLASCSRCSEGITSFRKTGPSVRWSVANASAARLHAVRGKRLRDHLSRSRAGSRTIRISSSRTIGLIASSVEANGWCGRTIRLITSVRLRGARKAPCLVYRRKQSQRMKISLLA